MRFRKRPVEVEAIHFDGSLEAVERGLAFVGRKAAGMATAAPQRIGETRFIIEIMTLEGTMTVSPGDWIIRGVAGEFYPCKPDIFDRTYEACE